MAFLRAFGRYVPSRVVPNAELAARLGCEADWILNVSGITERRWAANQETVVDMAAAAAGDCLSRASLNTTSVGMVIVASGTAGRRFPVPPRKRPRGSDSPASPRSMCPWPARARCSE